MSIFAAAYRRADKSLESQGTVFPTCNIGKHVTARRKRLGRQEATLLALRCFPE